ncbi:unnamed protein product, partial [Musa acuminata subsp. malaccensis]|uniref:(wild Malaysian banana) hypothetical protein n=1 Tax=Musa acuminata subsp. malaccensis TaxID=214687 RepID=A0A804J667_MUSAM
MPTYAKLPMMVITVESLPGCEKERLINGDVSIERELVATRIEESKEGSVCPKAQVIRLLGRAEEIGPQISAVLFEQAIRAADFSPESLACLLEAPWKIPTEEYETKKDLRNTCTFTIDPTSATDLDDALSIEKVSEKVFRIGVHIANVSRFVLPDTTLDREARIQSTSVYIPQHKLPMLPPELSEEACSLVSGEDMLAFTITWDIDDTGNITVRSIGRSVIHSCCKLSYDDFDLKDVVDSLKSLHGITKKMREIRLRNGAFWIETPKLVFLLDESGNPNDSFLGPMSMKLKEFQEFCRKRGLELDALDLRGRDDEWAHYGLSIPLYTHFTSPLRRYADIIVHNIGCTLLSATVRYGVPASEVVSEVAAYCNERKRASKHAEQSVENIYLSALLKNKEVMFSDARVLRVGSTFMTFYINKFAIERRIYFGEVEGLTIEWTETTGTLVLNALKTKPS